MKKMKNKGMTLVELIVALGFLGIVMVPVISQILFITTTNVSANEKLTNNNLCQAYTEQLSSAENAQVSLLLEKEQYNNKYIFFSIEKSEPDSNPMYFQRYFSYYISLTDLLEVDEISFSEEEGFFIIKYDINENEYLVKSSPTELGLSTAPYNSIIGNSITVKYANDWRLYDITVVVDEDDDFSDAKTVIKTAVYID